jgi:hypothetical protein
VESGTVVCVAIGDWGDRTVNFGESLLAIGIVVNGLLLGFFIGLLFVMIVKGIYNVIYSRPPQRCECGDYLIEDCDCWVPVQELKILCKR